MQPRAVIFDLDGTLTQPLLDFDLIRAEIGLGPGPILEQLSALTQAERDRAETILRRHEITAIAPLSTGEIAVLQANGLLQRYNGTKLDPVIAGIVSIAALPGGAVAALPLNGALQSYDGQGWKALDYLVTSFSVISVWIKGSSVLDRLKLPCIDGLSAV